MKKFFYKSSMLALVAGMLLSSCDPEIDGIAPSKGGQADFSKFIAVGNSLTAGTSDGGLSLEGQLSSFPAILAQQFQTVGGGEFVQPLFTEAQRNGSGYLVLAGFTPQGSPITAQVTTETAHRSLSPVLYTKYTEPVDNLAVPNIKIADINDRAYANPQNINPLTGQARFNPYFERLTNNTSLSYLEYVTGRVQEAKPTFFSNWLGNNDVLAYATSGGFSGVLTDVGTFTANYNQLLDVLTTNEAKGIVATIPDVTGIPFFTTVGPSLKASLKAKNVPAIVVLSKNTADRALLSVDNIRDASGGTALIPLTAAAYAPLIGQPTGKYWKELAKTAFPGNPAAGLQFFLGTYAIDTTAALGSPSNPWPSSLLLDETELKEVSERTIALNNVIKEQASSRNLALFDSYTYFNSIRGGFRLDGVAYSPAFITGNLFSLDGVHPTPRGYAIVANEMIKAINAKYNANVPTVDISQYRAVLLP